MRYNKYGVTRPNLARNVLPLKGVETRDILLLEDVEQRVSYESLIYIDLHEGRYKLYI